MEGSAYQIDAQASRRTMTVYERNGVITESTQNEKGYWRRGGGGKVRQCVSVGGIEGEEKGTCK